MAQQTSFDILIQKFSELPLELREAIARPETADTMNEIALRSALTGPQLATLVSQTGLVMGGVTSIPEYVATLRNELRLTDERLKPLVKDVAKLVLAPVDSSLSDIHGQHWREALENALLTPAPVPGTHPATPGDVIASFPATRPALPASPEPSIPKPGESPLSVVPPSVPPQPAVHQAPPPPSITMLEPHPTAPPFPKAPSLQTPPPEATPPSPASRAVPQFHPITIPEPQIAQKPPTTPPAKPSSENATNIIQAHYGGLSPAVRDAIKDVPISDVLFEIGKEQQLNVEQMGKMADTVMRFIAGKATQEEFLDTLLEDVFGGFRQKSAVVSQEINAKIFTPIRKALKVTTAEPTLPPKPSATPHSEKPAAPPIPKPESASPAPAIAPNPNPNPTPAIKTPSEPEPWIIYPLRSSHAPTLPAQDKSLAGLTSPIAVERPDRAGWGDAYPPIDHEVIPPIRSEGTTPTSGGDRGAEPPANLPTAEPSGISAVATPVPSQEHPPATPPKQSAPPQTPTQVPTPKPEPNQGTGVSHDPYREPPE